jgi:hypothetical protein
VLGGVVFLPAPAGAATLSFAEPDSGDDREFLVAVFLTAAGIPDRVDTGLGTLNEISNKTIEYK